MNDDLSLTKAEFLARYGRARERLFAFVYDLSESQLSVLRDPAGWAVKDHLAHLAVWQDGMSAVLRRQPRWPAMGLAQGYAGADELDAVNDAIYQRHRERTSGEVLAMLDRSIADFLAAFESLSDADLRAPYSAFQPDAASWTDPVVGWLVGNSYEHFDEHLPWMRTIAAGRINISSGAPWEDVVGYCRAVRVGNVVEVAGTAAVDEHGRLVGEGDAHRQAAFILTKIEHALAQAGATLRDVVRTRVFVTDIAHWEAVGRAHGAVFKDIKPVTSLVAVKALIAPEMLVEIEATAIVV